MIDWTLTYGNVYKQGALWLNQNAFKDANLTLYNGSMFAISPLFLRDDISLSPDHFSAFEQKGEYIMDLYNPFNPAVFAHRYPRKFLNPLKTILVDGFPLMTIYKNDPQFVKEKFKKEEELLDFKINPVKLSNGQYFYIDLDLKRTIKVTRLILSNISDACLNASLSPDELVSFLPGKEVFGVMEKKSLGQGKVEYEFAAEESRVVRIYPKSENSCFINGQISQVYFVAE